MKGSVTKLILVYECQAKMDACLTVEREQDRLAKKYTNIKEHTDSSLTELINQITSLQEELSKGKNKVLFFLRSVS